MEEFNLSMENVLDASDLELDNKVVEPEKTKEETKEPEHKEEEKKEEKQEFIENEATEVLDAANLELESVGGDKSEKETGSTGSQAEGTSPNTYSSIASAFKVDGVPLFSDADDERLSKIDNANDFEDFIKEKLEETVTNRLGETEKRINDALTYGMEPSDIQVFENSLKNLDSIKEEDINAETEEGENLRKNLIYTDLINRGFSEDRAKEKVQKIFENSTDIEEAKDALESNKKFYKAKYDEEFNARKAEYEKAVEDRKKDAEKLKKSILEDEKSFGEIKVDKATRQKIFDAINRPVGKDKQGRPVSALQKYADENPADFRKYLAYFYVVTDGFKSLDKVKESVSKEVRKKEISALERTLNSTARNTDGTLNLVGGKGGNYGSGEQTWQIIL